jgi:hypothetical protein
MKTQKCINTGLGALGLLLTILPSALFLFEAMQIDRVKQTMTIGMILWTVSQIATVFHKPDTSLDS